MNGPLVGEDVAKKLYAVSDVVNMSMANQRDNQPSQNQKPGTKNFSEMKQKRNLDFRRTASMDAIHTGGIFSSCGQIVRDFEREAKTRCNF